MKYAKKSTSLQKNLTMKTSLLCLALATLTSCYLIDPPLKLGRPRASCGVNEPQPTDALRPDTCFIISAVSFPASYDWQRDSAYGAVECTLLLYRNGKKELEIPAGPKERISASPDKHHIIGGSLYTEYSDRRGTCIKRNGQTIASWEGPERLLGLLCKDGVTYSLGLSGSGEAVTYRKDGQVVLKLAGASVFGSFGSNGYGPAGALYEDEGAVCFAYKTTVPGGQTAVLVRNGRPETVMSSPGTDLLDVKSVHGEALVLYNESRQTRIASGGKTYVPCRYVYWQEGELIEYNGNTAIVGSYRSGNGRIIEAIGWDGTVMGLGPDVSYIYCDGRSWHKVEDAPDGRTDCYFFHRHCACQLGNGLAYVLTPRDRTLHPFMQYGSDTVEFNLHGYLSGIAVEIAK